MDISREKATDPETGASIRLRYSTQLPGGGRTQAIDTEISIPVGASHETRDQLIREAEMSVKQLAQQIAQRSVRPGEEARVQNQSRPGAGVAMSFASPALTRPDAALSRSRPEPSAPSGQRQMTNPSLPAVHAPIGESMPLTPVSGGDGNTVRLPQFLSAISRHLKISPTDAMKLLKVDTLDGLNYRDAYRQLQTLVEQRAAETADFNTTPPSIQSSPVTDTPHQPAAPPQQGVPAAAEQGPRTQNQVALRSASRPAPPTVPVVTADEEVAPASERRRESRPGREGASPSKAPVPIQIGVEVMREPSTARSYTFDEEEEEGFEEGEDEEEDDEDYVLPVNREQERASAQLKLERLTTIRGGQIATPARLKALSNVIDSQISEEQLAELIRAAWGVSSARKLKHPQVEELISWAKEDYFVEEVESILKLTEGGEA